MASGLKSMQQPLTDAGPGETERGCVRAFLLPQAITTANDDAPDGGTAGRLERLTLALCSASTDRLKAAFIDQARRGNTQAALMVSAEMTRRGIAPCFRGLPVKPEWWCSDPDVSFAFMAADLQWIVASHPDHRTDWDRAQALFKRKTFRQAAEYLHWEGNRTAGQVAKAVGLTEDQQRECAWVQCLHVARWRQRLHMRWPIAQARISAAIKGRDRRPAEEQDSTITRRANLWLCAELADWKPQRTTDLYAMLTGETLPRNLVGKQLAKLPKVRRTDLFSPS
jgi:hypothetical protein